VLVVALVLVLVLVPVLAPVPELELVLSTSASTSTSIGTGTGTGIGTSTGGKVVNVVNVVKHRMCACLGVSNTFQVGLLGKHGELNMFEPHTLKNTVVRKCLLSLRIGMLVRTNIVRTTAFPMGEVQF
jgi:hypothetical protein